MGTTNRSFKTEPGQASYTLPYPPNLTNQTPWHPLSTFWSSQRHSLPWQQSPLRRTTPASDPAPPTSAARNTPQRELRSTTRSRPDRHWCQASCDRSSLPSEPEAFWSSRWQQPLPRLLIWALKTVLPLCLRLRSSRSLISATHRHGWRSTDATRL